MTKGAWMAEDVGRHLRSCAQCCEVKPEEVRISQPEAWRQTVPDAVLAAMCPDGRTIFRAYLRWLAEAEG